MVGMFGKVLAEYRGEGQAQIAVDIDLAHGHLGGLAQHIFRHALGAGHIAAELVDHVNVFGDNGGSAVEHDGETGQLLGHLFQNVKAQPGLALELEGAMAGADGNGQTVNAGAGDKLLHLGRIGIAGIVIIDGNGVFHAGQAAQLAFYRNVAVMGVFHYFFREGDVFFKGQVASVDHDAGEPAVDTAFAGFKIRAVIQVDHDGQIRIQDGGLDHFHQIDVLGIFACACGNLQDQRRVFQFAAFSDPLDDFHIIDVKSANGITAFVCLAKQFPCIDKWHVKKPSLRRFSLLYQRISFLNSIPHAFVNFLTSCLGCKTMRPNLALGRKWMV